MIESLTHLVGLFTFKAFVFDGCTSVAFPNLHRSTRCNPRRSSTRIFLHYTDTSTSKMDYLIWAIPAALWIIVSLDAASRQTPLLLLDRTHKL